MITTCQECGATVSDSADSCPGCGKRASEATASVFGSLFAFVAGGICAAAGVYLLSFRSAAAAERGSFDVNAFDVLTHGIGIYAIGKGLAIWGGAVLMLRRR